MHPGHREPQIAGFGAHSTICNIGRNLAATHVALMARMSKQPAHLTPINRRRLLISGLAGAGGAALTSIPTGTADAVPTSGTLPPLTAHATEGPYYLPLDLMRSNIAEGRSGVPIDIRFVVIDEVGAPFAGALVDVWHCDAQGSYSGVNQRPGGPAGPGTYLRGTQKADAQGLVQFRSIYPGWYHGRTTHIHFKVRHGASTHLTSQFFLPDALSEFLYTQVSDYHRDTLRDTLNSDDGIAIAAGDTVEGTVRETKGRYSVALTIRVDRRVIAPAERFAGPEEPGGPGGPGRPDGPPPGPPPSAHDGDGTRFAGKGSPPGMGPGVGPPPHDQAITGPERTAALLPSAARSARHGPPPSGRF